MFYDDACDSRPLLCSTSDREASKQCKKIYESAVV